MNYIKIIVLAGVLWQLSACGPVHNAVTNQYKLETFSSKKMVGARTSTSILISQPDAMAGYQTEEMLYTDKPFELSSFAHNAWISSPATMLYPLIIQSLQHSHYFYAVASGPDADKTDYRLDTQLIELEQNFLTKPSVIQLIAKVTLTHVRDTRVVSSRLISERVACPEDTPYGGVVAANKAAYAFTGKLSDFVIRQIRDDSAIKKTK